MGVQNPNSTSYVHPDEPNLLNLHKAMQYNQIGEPEIRVHVDGINLEGNVLVSNVSIDSGNITVWQGTDPWTVDGNVGVSGNVGISQMPAITGNVGILGNVTVNQGSNPWITNVGAGPQVDTTNRLRVSTVQQSWHYTPTVDKDGDLRLQEKFVDTGASYFIHNLASVNITSGTGYNANVALTGTAIRASRRRFKLRPGVAHQWLGTINWDGAQTGVTKRVGMFTNFNGMFFQLDGTLSVVIRRRLMNGTMVETSIPRGSWNGDNLDGTGVSGENWDTPDQVVNIVSAGATLPVTVGQTTVYNVAFTVDDVTKFALGTKVQVTGINPATMNAVGLIDAIGTNTITLTFVTNPGSYVSASSAKMTQTPFHMMYTMWFDFQGGRANTIRFGMNSPRGAVVLHTYNANGQLSTQYENAPSLMERKEIVNTGPVSVIPSLTLAGSCFNVEAELELNPGFGVATNNNRVTFPKGGTAEYAILGIGLRSGEPYQRSDLQLQSLSMTDIANINQQNAGIFYWRLVLNPTLGGTVPAPANIGKTSRQWDFTTATTFSGGIDLLSGYASSTQQFDIRTALNFVNLGSNIDYTDADKVVLIVKQLVGGTNDAQIVATMNFIEAL